MQEFTEDLATRSQSVVSHLNSMRVCSMLEYRKQNGILSSADSFSEVLLLSFCFV